MPFEAWSDWDSQCGEAKNLAKSLRRVVNFDIRCLLVMLQSAQFTRSFWPYIDILYSVRRHHPTCLTNLNKSLEWSPHSVWDHRVHQRSSYQLLEDRYWVTERFLSLPPGRGTVCRQQSLLRQPCIHSVESWKLISTSPFIQPCIQWTLWDHRYGLMFTLSAFARYSFQPALRLSRPGCLVPCRGGLPIQRRSVTHLGSNRA